MGRRAAFLTRIWDLLAGREERLRLRSTLTLTALVAFALFAAFQHLEVVLGLIDREASHRLTAFNLGGSMLLYLAVRTRLSEKISRDPSLSVPQMVHAMCAITWSYAITGPARGAVMGIMILVILFGVFRLNKLTTLRLAVLGFGMLAAAMAWKAWTSPEHYDPRVEVIHLIFGSIVMGGTAALVMQLGALRSRLARQRAELEKALELNRELATRDGLTGLLNRRAAHEVLAREHPRVARGQGSLGLALLDIDHFKRINDVHGHDVGDQVLQRLAHTLDRQLRPGDALVRWGGEEFLLLMPGTGLADAQRTLARLRASLADAGFEALLGGAGVTFSAGLVQCMAHESHEAAMVRADRALYRAKAGGRDRVECDPADGLGRADLAGESGANALHAAPLPAEAR